MPHDQDPHADLAAYLIGALDANESTAFADHLRTCATCRAEAEELGIAAGGLAVMPPRHIPPPDLKSKVLAAVAEAAATDDAAEREWAAPSEPERAPSHSPRGTRFRLWPAFAGLAGAAALIAAFLIGSNTTDDATRDAPRGTVEIASTMKAPNGTVDGDLTVTALASGREVEFESDSLPILPTGDYYALWFVGSGDTPSNPNRISAGTFHPDEEGISSVVMHAAVDPALYPRVEITKEPGDGDPAPTQDVVAELDATDVLK